MSAAPPTTSTQTSTQAPDTALDVPDEVSARIDAALADMVPFDLSGFWLGNYGSNGLEAVVITHTDSRTIVATKVTGDRHVPAGELTFRVRLEPGKKEALGEIQIANENFVNAQWVEGRLQYRDPETFVFFWSGSPDGRTFKRIPCEELGRYGLTDCHFFDDAVPVVSR